MRVALETLGCRLNQAESDSMEAALVAAGHDVAERPADAEVLVVNSCTITHQADADTRRAIRRARRANPGVRVVVTGCYANADPEGLAALEGVDAVIGNADKTELGTVLASLQPERSQPAFVSVTRLGKRPAVTALTPARSRHRTRALLKVQDGCNYRCAFCIVPMVRGGSRSVPVEDAVAQLEALVRSGAREVVLTGIHLGTYGRDLRPRRSLADLVSALLAAAGPARVRLSSLDPHEVDDDLIELLASRSPALCRHLHLPVQSGDEDVLRAMRRGHTAADFSNLCARLLRRVPGISIGTDVIVGFPGESEAAFEQTYQVLEQHPLAYHHVFSYSRRDGTSAATMPEQVSPAVIRSRNARLRELSGRQGQAFAERFVGQRLDAVALKGGRVITDNYLQVPWHGEPLELGVRASVRLASGDDGVFAAP